MKQAVEKLAHLNQTATNLLGTPQPVGLIGKQLPIMTEMGETRSAGDKNWVIISLEGGDIAPGQHPGSFRVTGGMHGQTAATKALRDFKGNAKMGEYCPASLDDLRVEILC